MFSTICSCCSGVGTNVEFRYIPAGNPLPLPLPLSGPPMAPGDGPGPGAQRRQGPDVPSTDRLADFVTRMNEFIESSSGMDGVEVPEAAAAPRQPAAKPRANEFLPEDSLELETETMIGALRRALQVDVAECSSSDSDDIDDEDDEDDDGGLGGLFGDDEQDEEDREITNEVLCELSDYVKKRKEEETRARAEARLRGRAAGVGCPRGGQPV